MTSNNDHVEVSTRIEKEGDGYVLITVRKNNKTNKIRTNKIYFDDMSNMPTINIINGNVVQNIRYGADGACHIVDCVEQQSSRAIDRYYEHLTEASKEDRAREKFERERRAVANGAANTINGLRRNMNGDPPSTKDKALYILGCIVNALPGG